MDEQLLIQRAVAGDGAALATLLLDCEQGLLAYARRRLPGLVRSLASPEDIVQETCYEACRMVRGFAPQGASSFNRWLTRIANLRIKATIQKYRTRRTRAVSADDSSVLSAIEQLVVYRRTPSRSAAAHEFVLTFEHCLERLIPDYRQVIVYRFIEGLNVEETAQRMGRDNNQIYVLCSRALGALRAQMPSVSHFV